MRRTALSQSAMEAAYQSKGAANSNGSKIEPKPKLRPATISVCSVCPERQRVKAGLQPLATEEAIDGLIPGLLKDLDPQEAERVIQEQTGVIARVEFSRARNQMVVHYYSSQP